MRDIFDMAGYAMWRLATILDERAERACCDLCMIELDLEWPNGNSILILRVSRGRGNMSVVLIWTGKQRAVPSALDASGVTAASKASVVRRSAGCVQVLVRPVSPVGMAVEVGAAA